MVTRYFLFFCSCREPYRSRWLMRHRIGNNVDAQRVCLLDRKLLEVPFVFSFTFPAVSQVVGFFLVPVVGDLDRRMRGLGAVTDESVGELAVGVARGRAGSTGSQRPAPGLRAPRAAPGVHRPQNNVSSS